MKFFLDENLSSQHAIELRSDGFDAVAVAEVGLSGAADEQILHFAVSAGRVLVTLDADFANVIRFPPELTAGVLRLKFIRRRRKESGKRSGAPCCSCRTSI